MSVRLPGEITKAEAALVRELAVALADAAIGDEVTLLPSSDICASLELVLPAILRASHPAWTRESLDGVFVAKAVKSATIGVRLVGVGVLISDQTVTPLYAELEAGSPGDATLSSFDVRVGEPGEGTLGISGPPCGSRESAALLEAVLLRFPSIRWVYSARSGTEA